ncbi:Leucine-zipper-like transcriptional regulator 1 [Dimargaris verticillata]|uniref:Leucine-zipper-like transcriptional regulator 1 n=1 Tax=Dimargaris verticillata TaxID=2761393 RepID=A0A9W8AX10_9FUNG|nr:Leucine-zipper-like transcriptional regulator 1 [Dimargaris verticillata]
MARNNGKPEIHVFGGSTYEDERGSDPLRIYEVTNQQWTKGQALSSGDAPSRRYEHTAVAYYNDTRILLDGGAEDETTGAEANVQNAHLFEYDVTDHAWISYNQEINSPGPLMHHSALMINSTHMAVIGGFSEHDLVDISKIYIFDTVTHRWSQVTVAGEAPQSLREASAVVFKRQIIMFGGSSKDWSVWMDYVLIINMKTSPWTWESQIVQNAPKPRYAHTATLVGKYMLISFGFTQDGADDQLYVMDVEKFSMVKTFDLQRALEVGPDQDTEDKGLGGGTIAGIVVGCLAGLAVILTALWFFLVYRRRKDRQSNKLYQGRKSLDGQSDGSPPSATLASVSGHTGSHRGDMPSGTYPPMLHRFLETDRARANSKHYSERGNSGDYQPNGGSSPGAHGSYYDRDSTLRPLSANDVVPHAKGSWVVPDGFALPLGGDSERAAAAAFRRHAQGDSDLGEMEVQTVLVRKPKLFVVNAADAESTTAGATANPAAAQVPELHIDREETTNSPTTPDTAQPDNAPQSQSMVDPAPVQQAEPVLPELIRSSSLDLSSMGAPRAS